MEIRYVEMTEQKHHAKMLDYFGLLWETGDMGDVVFVRQLAQLAQDREMSSVCGSQHCMTLTI